MESSLDGPTLCYVLKFGRLSKPVSLPWAAKPCTLWIDNNLVYRRLCQFQQRTCWIKPNQKDADLWNLLYRCVRCLGTHLVHVVKVCSHQAEAGAEDEVETWAFRGNQAADSLADGSFVNAAAIWSLWSELSTQVSQIRTLRQHVHTSMIRVGRKAVHSRVGLASVAPSHPRPPRIAAIDVQPVDIPRLDSEALPAHLCFDGCQPFLDWLQELDVPGNAPRLVSWFQINLAFETDVRCRGVNQT